MNHHAIVLLWLSAAPRADFAAHINAWESARGFRAKPPVSTPDRRLGGYAADVVQRIESLLDQATIAAGSLDADRAEDLLASADALVINSPQLPQAAWLRAEVLTQRAALAVAAGDRETAHRLEALATALEGPRSAAYAPIVPSGGGEAATPLDVEPTRTDKPAASPTSGTLQTACRLVVRQRQGDTLYVDGLPRPRSQTFMPGQAAAPGRATSTPASFDSQTTVRAEAGRLEIELRLAAAPHHVRVVRHQQVVFAEWVTPGCANEAAHVTIPLPAPCSVEDLGDTEPSRDRPVPSSAVQCPHWAAARPAPRGGGVEVATCREDQCDPWTTWRAGLSPALSAPLHDAHPAGWPTWATYVLAGVGAAAATSIVLWRSGAFDEPEPGRTVFVFGGVQ